MTRIEQIGDATLYLGDCREILPGLGRVCACVTDPPYGIGEDGGKKRLRADRISIRVFEKKNWDASRPEKIIFDMINDIADYSIIWGGNYFADLLPAQKGWLYWDKKMGGDYSDGELAWTNIDHSLKSFSQYNKYQGRVHPAQKPINLLEWCIGHLPSTAQTILDPFMGSGTTGVACANLGRKFIGIELDETYFDMACKRIEEAYKQPDLFIAPPATKPVQETFMLESA